jgi:hypothetical protein
MRLPPCASNVLGKAAKRRDGQALATGHEHILAQLYGPAGDADDHERLEHALVRGGELVTVDHGDGEHELDLLLQGVEGLAGDGADRDHRSQPRRDCRRGTQGASAGDAPPSGTDLLQRQLVIGEMRMPGPQLVDSRLEGRFAAADHPGEAAEHGLQLGREPVQVHRGKRTAELGGREVGIHSHVWEAHLNTELRLSRGSD